MTHTSLVSLFSDIADAIRTKTGENGLIKADDFPTAISAIPTGGGGDVVLREITMSSSQTSNYTVTTTDELGFTPSIFFFGMNGDFSYITNRYLLLSSMTVNVPDANPVKSAAFVDWVGNASGFFSRLNAPISGTKYGGTYIKDDGSIYINLGGNYWIRAGNYFWIAVK